MRILSGLKSGPSHDRFRPEWYDERIAFVEELRGQGSLHEAKQVAIEVLYFAEDARRQLDSWPAVIRAGSPWQARKLRRYLRDWGLPRLRMLRDGIEQDQRSFTAQLAADALDPPTPPVGPIGPRSRPSSFAAAERTKRRVLSVLG